MELRRILLIWFLDFLLTSCECPWSLGEAFERERKQRAGATDLTDNREHRVTAMLLTGGSAVVNSLTGMPTAAACFLLPVGVVIYTLFGGIK